jgi:YVTN family beta-propeller protein
VDRGLVPSADRRGRRRLRPLTAGVLLAGTGLFGLATTAPASAAVTRPFLYVANGISNNVTVVNLSTNSTAATIPAGTQPQGAVVSADGRTVYIANAFGGISVIDTSTNTVTATIADSSVPIGLALNSSGSILYAANETGSVSVIDTASRTTTATISTPTEPLGIALSPDNSTLYVPDFIGNRLYVISTATNTVTATLTGFSRPIGAAVTPDGSTLYVANATVGTVSVISTATQHGHRYDRRGQPAALLRHHPGRQHRVRDQHR